ncbi:CYTH domain-containing protein [Pseudobacteroides cellulosolvens]|uniref:Adenylate cyclase n=1 Tax=Pseudobacteroides cellulosolvens ATCC 35603 = DSM 2933 TaxID=398512 RepID=A0A0L6JS82_9FIRM|nr:CYTH domain-containing protein [Pseudobacteroides cellulosolvens]KNY28252.1 adenylate cyclase [Pseudobacteroides cellulosolvens ATCC 35603 = DSM 2933]
MGSEIERKFLTQSNNYRNISEGVPYMQGYICSGKGKVVRVRVAGTKGYITIKGPHKGIKRAEYEYEIPLDDAKEMLENLCSKPLIEKDRFKVNYEGFVWEIDEFHGENEGLVVAEIELTDENQHFTTPEWIGKEVTGDSKYYNSSLIKNPYSKWNYV